MGDLEVNLKFPYRLAASILSVVSAYLGPAETGADPPCRENVDVAASFRVSTASPMLFVGLVSEEPDVADHPPLFNWPATPPPHWCSSLPWRDQFCGGSRRNRHF